MGHAPGSAAGGPEYRAGNGAVKPKLPRQGCAWTFGLEL